MNLYAGQGIAVREFPLTWGSADYLLFVDRQAVGVIEAKKEGVTLTGSGYSSRSRYPIPGSVARSLGREGSDSSLCRRCAM